VIEILFQEGLIKCLFATETFSIGATHRSCTCDAVLTIAHCRCGPHPRHGGRGVA
jgi:hypothetical protein